MLRTTNPAGYTFLWPDGSDIVEIYHPKAVYPELPFAAHRVDFRRDMSSLNKFANETPSYGVFDAG